ncbi:MAG: MBL fold metallo-hydrolase [Gammaproteobacteria bacterium]
MAPRIVTRTLAAFVLGIGVAGAADMALSSPLATGAVRMQSHLPAGAVDSDDVPTIVLKNSDRASDPLPCYRIAPNTYMFYGNIAEVDARNRGFNGNAGFVVTDRGVVAIDALGTPKLGERMIATIRSLTDRPVTHLILTHNHPDHSYGAIAFRRLGGVAVIAHRGALEYLNSTQMDRSVRYRRSFIAPDMAGFAPVRPDRLVDGALYDKTSLRVGDHRFDIYNTGNHHSHGDLVIHQLPENILWISDLAFNQRVTYMGDGDSALALRGEEWLLKNFSDVLLMVPGHGSAQTRPFPMVSRTHAYIQRLRETMARAIRHGVGLQTAVEQADFPDWRKVPLYDLNQRANANFVYREMEVELF